MGYETYFELTVEKGHEELIVELRKDNEEATWALEEDGFGTEPCRWYDYEEDLIEFSKKHPEVLFTLYGNGEESEDIWYSYYKNGKMQNCPVRFVFDDYDETKLEDHGI